MSIITIMIIAVALSMDAFSLALFYGTINLEKKQINKLSLTVGIFHFFMPLLGMCAKNTITYITHYSLDFLTTILFLYIGIQMIIESVREHKVVSLNAFNNYFLFGFAVSIDSFSIGMGLKGNFLVSAVMFSLFSAVFTYFGLKIGKKINQAVGSSSTIIGGIILIIMGLLYL